MKYTCELRPNLAVSSTSEYREECSSKNPLRSEFAQTLSARYELDTLSDR